MKKLALLALSMSCIMLFSFYQGKTDGIKKINASLWEIKSTSEMSVADQNQLKSLIQKEYGIKDFTTERTVDYKVQARKWWAITKEKWGRTVFSHTAVAGEGKALAFTATQKNIMEILQKNTPNQGQ